MKYYYYKFNPVHLYLFIMFNKGYFLLTKYKIKLKELFFNHIFIIYIVLWQINENLIMKNYKF